MSTGLKIYEYEQGSNEWFMIRLGHATASRFADVLNKKTGRGKYMRKLAAERLTGEHEDTYTNAIMERGIEVEAQARVFYEHLNNVIVQVVGFVELSEFVGASPDGLIGDDGVLEIKSPLSSTHIEYILKDAMPAVYVPQVQGLLCITGREWCDFISFDPRVKSRPFFCKRVYRDAEYIETLSKAVDVFVDQLDDMIKQITTTKF